MIYELKATGKVLHFLFWADDLHWHHYEGYVLKNKTFSIPHLNIIASTTQFSIFFPHIKKKAIWIPHTASLRFQRAFNDRAIQKVLLTGRVDHFYPYRQHALSLMQSGNENIVMIGHPGYGNDLSSTFHLQYVEV